MKLSRIVVGVVVCGLMSHLCWSQEESPASSRKALGYFDYSTGVFRPIGVDSNTAPANTQLTGTFVVNFNITLKSVLPATAVINCGVSADAVAGAIPAINSFSESANVAATRTGNTAKCTVTIPYSWTVSDSSVGSVSLTYTLSASKAPTGTTGLLGRMSSGGIGTIALPANGATTTQTVNTVL